MPNSFDFATAPRILFGRGRLNELSQTARGLGARRALVVTGASSLKQAGIVAMMESCFQSKGLAWRFYRVAGEPKVSTIDEGVSLVKHEGCDVVIGVGGGSAMDTAKAIAALTTNGGTVLDYLEGGDAGRTLEKPALPCIAVPTTAGTGAEVTRNAVVGSDDGTSKKSIRGSSLAPAVALVDPSLTDSNPPALTATCGLDALTQLVESYTSTGASPLTDSIALDGIRRIAAALPRAFENGREPEARDEMAMAALESGICLANAGLGAVHGLSAPLGGRFPVPHGAACAALLASVTETNVQRARREDARLVLERYASLAGSIGRKEPEEFAAWLRDLQQSLQIPGLAAYGLDRGSIPAIVRGARGRSMRFNPFVLTDEELTGILDRSL